MRTAPILGRVIEVPNLQPLGPLPSSIHHSMALFPQEIPRRAHLALEEGYDCR